METLVYEVEVTAKVYKDGEYQRQDTIYTQVVRDIDLVQVINAVNEGETRKTNKPIKVAK